MKLKNPKNNISNPEVINLARGCFQKYVNEMGWKTSSDIRIDIVEIYESVIYPGGSGSI